MKCNLHFRQVGMLAAIVALAAACAPTPVAAPTLAPPLAAVTTPTTAAAASPTSAPTATTAAPTSAPTRPPATAEHTRVVTVVSTQPAPTGNPSGSAANVFATAIRLSPAQPVGGPDYVTFHVTFNNTSGKTQSLKWYVKIWSPDNATQSFGETALQVTDIPAGTSEVASAANWRTNPLTCMPFTARVYWVNSDVNFGNPNEFKKPDGSAGPIASFQVCPATPKP